MSVFAMLNRRLVGFRVIELMAALVLTAMILTVYMAKTGAGDKTDDIDRIESQIQAEQTRIRLLKAEVATEEQPHRLTALATQYLGLAPIAAKHEIDIDALADIAEPAVAKAPAPAPTSAPAATAQTVQPAAYVSANAAPAPPPPQAEDR